MVNINIISIIAYLYVFNVDILILPHCGSVQVLQMSKAMKSDGVINKCVKIMCDRRFKGYDRKKVDRILNDEDALKQCTHGTLCYAFYVYESVYNDKNWFIQRHIEIKAWQSAVWRDFAKDVGHHKSRPQIDDKEQVVEEDPLDTIMKKLDADIPTISTDNTKNEDHHDNGNGSDDSQDQGRHEERQGPA